MPIHGYPGNVITANPTAPTVSSASGVWTTEQQLQAMAAGNWPMAATQISRSLRFNSADSAQLNRTFSTTGTSTKTLTFSFWVKRTTLGQKWLVGAFNSTDSSSADIFFTSSDTLEVRFGSSATTGDFITTQVFRDISSWYHIVVAVDTTQATNTNRFKLYVNGSQVTAFGTATYPSQNITTSWFNTSANNRIGSAWNSASFFDGYITEFYAIDGQALTPSSFGFNSSDTGVWEPRQYTGPYGTNGFYLNFSDNSNTTAATLGKDYSGNGNNWTPNNFSVSAGAGNDSLVDSPTAYGTDTGVGGEVRGNYATLNPLDNGGNTVSNGNLVVTVATGFDLIRSTMFLSSGKWYWEITCDDCGEGFVGVSSASEGLNTRGAETTNSATIRTTNGDLRTNATNTAYGSAVADGNVMMFALDMDAGKFWAGKQGTWFNSGDPAAGTNAGKTGLTVPVSPSISVYDNEDYTANFGQRAFAYTAPSGFKALCTQNLPTPTIGATSTTQADNYFGVALYSGTGSGNSNVVSGLEFTTDLWWQKARNAANNNYLQDAVRGFGASKSLTSNSTGTEGFNGTPLTQSLSVSSTGFTVSGSDFNGNTASETYVAWCWNAGGSTVTNTTGSISAQVRANTTAGFSIVTYTGTGANATVGHGLGVAPQMLIIKNRQAANSWVVYHVSIGNGNVLLLNSTGASTSDSTAWNTTTPTSTVFSLGSGAAADTNQTSGGGQHVAYCFAPVAGYSAFGSYTGNGSTDGPFVYLGFRPRFLLLKISSTTGNWAIYDTSRNTYNVMDLYLYPNSSAAEGGSGTPRVDALSNGFKLRNSGQDNTSSATYIYACFAEFPFKFSLAR